jgi:hypothetical protein
VGTSTSLTDAVFTAIGLSSGDTPASASALAGLLHALAKPKQRREATNKEEGNAAALGLGIKDSWGA